MLYRAKPFPSPFRNLARSPCATPTSNMGTAPPWPKFLPCAELFANRGRSVAYYWLRAGRAGPLSTASGFSAYRVSTPPFLRRPRAISGAASNADAYGGPTWGPTPVWARSDPARSWCCWRGKQWETRLPGAFLENSSKSVMGITHPAISCHGNCRDWSEHAAIMSGAPELTNSTAQGGYLATGNDTHGEKRGRSLLHQ